MSDADTGTGAFPSDPQSALTADSLVCRKSNTADGATRSYIAYADERTIYFFCQTGDIAGVYFAFAFGEFYSFVESDAYRTMIIGRITENLATAVLRAFRSSPAR